MTLPQMVEDHETQAHSLWEQMDKRRNELAKADPRFCELERRWQVAVRVIECLKELEPTSTGLCPLCCAATGGPEPEDPFTDE